MPTRYTTAGMPKNIRKYVGEKRYKVRIHLGDYTYNVGIYTDLSEAIKARDKFTALPTEDKIRLAKDKAKVKPKETHIPSPHLKGTPFYGL
jgi:hypothetical protein